MVISAITAPYALKAAGTGFDSLVIENLPDPVPQPGSVLIEAERKLVSFRNLVQVSVLLYSMHKSLADGHKQRKKRCGTQSV